MFRKIALIFLNIALFVFLSNLLCADDAFAETRKPSLSTVIFFGLTTIKECQQNKSLKTNDCFQKYLKAIPAKSFLVTAAGPSGLEDTLQYRRRNLEEQIVIIMGDKTRDEAKAFSQAVPLYTEWERMSENPLNEADFVDTWLQKHPATPIAAFLYLFKAHRLRAGFEAAKAGDEQSLWPVLAVKYKESVGKARVFDNPLITCIAQDLEEQPYVYLEGYGRP